MQFLSTSLPHDLARRSRMLLGLFAMLVSLTSMASSSGVNCCPDERTTPPPESAFVELGLTGSAKAPSFKTWRTRSAGHPILLLHALNGISPSILHWALEMETWGYRVYIPSLYGDPIGDEAAYGYDNGIAATKLLAARPEWDLNSIEHPGSIVNEIRALAAEVSSLEGNADIAVIGNCLTGIFPLAVMDEPFVRVAVLSQPALPVMKLHQIFLRLPQPEKKQRALPLSGEHLAPIIAAMKGDPSKQILGFHYVHDPVAPIAKFDAIHEELAAAGLEDHFTAYLMEKHGSSYAADRPDWTIGKTTAQKRKLLTPHSTLSNPESLDDRAWFRAHLRAQLDKAWE